MRISIYLILFTIICGGCGSSRSFNFKEAYKFSHYRYQKNEGIQAEHPAISPISASSYQSFAPVLPKRLPYLENGSLAIELTRQEKREVLREARKITRRLRKLTREDPVMAEIEKEKATKELTGKVYAGTVVGAAGLVLLILDIATPLGVLAVVAGLALIVWGLLERGRF